MNIFYDYRETHGFSIVEEDGKFGVASKDNVIIIPIEFNYIFGLNKNGLSLMIKNNLYGVMNKLAQVVVPVEFDDVNKFPKDVLEQLK